MSLSENTHHWLERLRAELDAIPDEEEGIIATMLLAEVEFAHGLDDDARATLVRCLQSFDVLQPGAWNPLVYRAAELCGRLSENRLLETEVLRGMAWLAQPEIVKYQTGLPERVHEIAIQVGRADVADALVSDAWPGRPVNKLVDACRLAGWATDAVELRRLLPLAREAIGAAEPGREQLGNSIGYWLARACVLAGLLAEATEVVQAFGFPGEASDELVITLWATANRAAYGCVRDGWLKNRIDQFRAETRGRHHWRSGEVRHCAETIRQFGDADGYRNAIRQFREVVAEVVAASGLGWQTCRGPIACIVNCDLAVLHANAGEAQISADYFSAARRLFEGQEPGVTMARGDRSMMAPILSAAYRDVGEIDLALRIARRSSHKGERSASLISALILGGRDADAEVELAKFDKPQDRAYRIGHTLLSKFRVGASTQIIMSHHQ
jgi:hypothetical protein